MRAVAAAVLARSAVLACSAAPGFGAGAGPDIVGGDVVVYGATAAGCVAAIAASRSGARGVVVATPYSHVGGMTTGGIMHADGGNSTVIHGITREYFERVMGHYPPSPHPSPSPSPSAGYSCTFSQAICQLLVVPRYF